MAIASADPMRAYLLNSGMLARSLVNLRQGGGGGPAGDTRSCPFDGVSSVGFRFALRRLSAEGGGSRQWDGNQA